MKKDEAQISQIVPGVISGPTRKKQMKIIGRLIPSKIKILENEKRAITVEDEPINLYMEVPEKDWSRFQEFVSNHPEQFLRQFESVFVNPLSDKNIPHAKQRFVDLLKKVSAVLHEYFSYWCARKLAAWPEFLRKIIKQADIDNFPIIVGQPNSLCAYHMTEYCIKRLYGSTIDRYELNLFEDGSRNFMTTYITDGKKVGKVKGFLTDAMKNKTPLEIENLAYSYPYLKKLFKKLNVL
jgi:hypothetical protein